MLASSFMCTHDGVLCLIIQVDGPHCSAIHWIRHAQILERRLCSGENSAEHGAVDISMLEHFARAMVGVGEKALRTCKSVRQMMLQEFAWHRVFF